MEPEVNPQDYKIIDNMDLLVKEIKHLKESGAKIIFTNGCFDILHPGHIYLLNEASKEDGFLIVGLNSDRSVRELKGEGRPFTPERERAEMLASLEVVDYVVIFDEKTPENLIKQIKPNVLVKGSDYEFEQIVGAEFVQDRGGTVLIVDIKQGYSTTKLIGNITGT